jgi:hypothetical protein
MNYKDVLEKAETNRQQCSLCGRCIPSHIPRISFGYRSAYGSSNKRLCGLCIIELSEHINKEDIEDWKNKIIIKAI